MGISLRPYQMECIETIKNQKPGKYLISLATGLGKTVTFANIPRQGRMLILSHRQELVFQPRKYFNCSYGVEMANYTSNGEEVVSASIMSIARRLHKFNPNDFDIIVVDECHHAVAPTYRRVIEYFNARLVLGFTATANRADKQMLGEIFEKIIYNKDLRWGIENGYLSPISDKSCRVDLQVDLSALQMVAGDFSVNDLAKAIDTPERNKIVAQAYEEKAVGQTIIFAASVAHAQHLAEYIPDSVVVTGETANREQIIKDFTARKFRCLINCMVFTEGTDMPLIETVIVARPTCNSSLYTQMVGRGLRLAEGKSETVLIDCVGVSRKCNLCEFPHLFNVDGGDEVVYEGDQPKDKKEEEKEKKVVFLPAFNKEFVDIDVMGDNFSLDNYSSYAWFFTCKSRKTGKVVTKILHTDDIDSAVYRIRKQGFTFVTLISYETAVKLSMKLKKRCKMVHSNLDRIGNIEMDHANFFRGLLEIEAEGKINDNIDEALIQEYLDKTTTDEEEQEAA